MKDTPMYQVYQQVAPRPEDFPRLLDKIGESMAKGYDHTEAIRSLQAPTLIVAADADMAPPSHHVEIFKLLDGGLRDGGWMARAGRRAVTRSRSYPASPTTTSSARRCSPPSLLPSSTSSSARVRA
jgi:hypothetical protein